MPSFINLNVARAAILANLITTDSVLAGVTVLHESLTAGGIVCCALILVGIYWRQRWEEVMDYP